MISEIDNKMYELMTEEQNFEFAYYIHNNYESIKVRLKNEFLIELKSELMKDNNEIIVKKNEEYVDYYEICYKYKKVKFYFQLEDNNIQYGIVLEHNGTKKKIKEIEFLFEKYLELDYNSTQNDSKYWLYQIEEEDFNEFSSLKKLLPKNRDVLINKYCKNIIKLINEVFEEIIKFEEKF